MVRDAQPADDRSPTTQVAIVGGGPTGLVLALFLDFYGIRTTLFEAEANPRWHPKGNTQNARTMEHYRRLGFSDDVRRLGLPGDHPFDQAYFTRLSAHEIYRYPKPSRDRRIAMRRERPVTDQLPEPLFHVNQMYVERYMLERARARPNIDVRCGWQVQRYSQDETGVRLTAARTDGAGEATWRADYAVACDGGRSFVRKTLGIGYEGDVQRKDAYWAGQFFSVYMRIPDLYPKFVGHRRAWMYWPINPDPQTRGVIIALNGVDEFMMLVKATGGSDVDTDYVAGCVQQSIGADIPVHILGYQPWSAGQALVAERYVAGRTMIAGDAAHLFTPTGGFGMNTGIDDTSNLAWKLAAVLQGWGGAHLLDSYEAERKPVGYRNTGASRKYASLMHDVVVPEDIEAEGPPGEAARRAVAEHSYVRRNHFVRPEHKDGVGVHLGGRYDGSPVIVPDGAPPEDRFPETFDEYFPSGVPGGRAPHLWLDDERVMGSSLFDRFGRGFTLLRLDPATRDAEALARTAARRGVPLTILDLDIPEARALYGRGLALIRPDQYIAWRGDTPPDDPDALLARVTGH